MENWVVIFPKDTIPMDTIIFDVTNHSSGFINNFLSNVKPISVFDVFVNDVKKDTVSSRKEGTVHFEITTPFWASSPSQTSEIKVMLKQDLPNDLNVMYDGQWVIYPNPTTGSIRIKVSEAILYQKMVLDIYDYLGRKIVQDLEVNTSNVNIDLAPYKNGIFLIVLRSGETNLTKKVLKL